MSEASLTVAVLFLLALGILEFGRAFVIVGAINEAARGGARSIAFASANERDAAGYVVDPSPIIDRVREEMTAVVSSGVADSMTVTVAQSASDPPLAQVTISGHVPYMFNLVGSDFVVNRTVSFRDNGR